MECISAIATPMGKGGVAVIRVSGDGAEEIARRMTGRASFEPNRMYAGEIDCGAFKDYGLTVLFRAPKSFTGEDVAEFHCHGGIEIAHGVFSRTVELGARPAERGEFTRRAFLNGKLSLTAVEGMGEMIEAESASHVRAGYSLYTEQLLSIAKELQKKLSHCLAGIDADVDYPEEDLTADSRSEISATLTELIGELSALYSRYGTGEKIKSGVNVVLCGKPNAGKSSLLNALLGYDRAIVSSEAGTTRDTVEGTAEINGVLFRLTDTAGLREGHSAAETEGIRRAERAILGADVIVWLKEEELPPADFPENTPLVVVGAKSDLVRREGCDVLVSAVTGEGMEELKLLIFSRGAGEVSDQVYLMTQRQASAVRNALNAARRALAAAEAGEPAELYAQDLAECNGFLSQLTGENAAEDVIAEIFSHFCVGK